jgi:hypothetical protein
MNPDFDDGTEARTARLNAPADNDWGELFLVWGTWAAMVVAGAWFIHTYGVNLPFCDDFGMVPAISGAVDNWPEWLWSLCAEHRVPVPRLIQYVLYRATDNDFRSGMYFNLGALALLAASMVVAARRLRGSTQFADLFFPVALLNWGHWENLISSWQVQFISSSVLTGILIVIAATAGATLTLGRTWAAGFCLVLLPLCGANGLAFVPAVGFWLIAASVEAFRRRQFASAITGCLFVAFAAAISGVYFIGFQKTDQGSPAIDAALRTTLEFLTVCLGPAANRYWPYSAAIVAGLFVSGILALVAVMVRAPSQRLAALGLFCIIGGVLSLAIGLGYGRASLGFGFAPRYYTIAAPGLCAVFFAWILYKPFALGRLIQITMMTLAVVSLLPNMQQGQTQANERRMQMLPFAADLAAGLPLSQLAEKHTVSLYQLNPNRLFEFLEMLERGKVGVFRGMKPDPRWRETNLPLVPIRVHDLTWADGKIQLTGGEPFVAFALEPSQFAYAIQLTFRERAPTSPMEFRLSWCHNAAGGQFGDPARTRTWQQDLSPGDTTRRIWINDTVDRLRLDVLKGAGEFQIESITLLQPIGSNP